jgi:predicted phosphodiesterase
LKIGLASDSFGNLEALGRALRVLHEQGAERIFFLGGRFSDVEGSLRDGAEKTAPTPAPATTSTDLGFLAAVEGALTRQMNGAPADAAVAAILSKIVRVASKACPEWHQDEVPKKLIEMTEGFLCCLVHDKSELSKDDIENATILFHGNSAHPALVQIGPRFFVTPGHLRDPAPVGKPASFALCDVSTAGLELVVFSSTGSELRRQKAAMGNRTKMSIK